jgi:acyl-CoA thioester hydrolase
MGASALHDAFTSRGHIVRPDWIDAYDHMNMARYVALFDDVTYDLLDNVGLGVASTQKTRRGLFIVDARVRFLTELRVGTPLAVSLRLVGVDHVRLHMWLELRAEGSGKASATMEQMGLHASLETRKTMPFPADHRARIEAIVAQHASEPGHASRVLTMACRDGEQPRG